MSPLQSVMDLIGSTDSEEEGEEQQRKKYGDDDMKQQSPQSQHQLTRSCLRVHSLQQHREPLVEGDVYW